MGRDHTHVDPNQQVPQKEEQRYERRGEVRTHRADPQLCQARYLHRRCFPTAAQMKTAQRLGVDGLRLFLAVCWLVLAVPSPDCSFHLKSLWKVHWYSRSNVTSSVLALGTIAGETEPVTHASMCPSPASRDI